MIITIDGPVASGKSTVARQLAQELHFYYLYTGFLYRGLAYVLAYEYGYDDIQMRNVQQADLDAIVHAQEQGKKLFEYRYEQGAPKIFFKDKDISLFLKTKEIDNYSSLISAQPQIRQAIFEYQVQMGREQNLVAEGRDVGTIVFPEAEYKFFLTASVDVRAKRWQEMQKKLGDTYTFEESKIAIMERDRRDEQRAHSPLKPADDAIIIDCSDMNVHEVVQKIKSYISQ
jgi:CMP/dCMP kinase